MGCEYSNFPVSSTLADRVLQRDFLAGVLTIPAVPFFSNIGKSSGKNLEYACTILFCISFVLVVAVYIIYWKGPVLRKRSPFAQRLADARQEQPNTGRRTSYIGERRGTYICHTTSDIDDEPLLTIIVGSTASSRAAQRPGVDRRYSQQNRFFGENRVTPKQTPRGTPSASRRPSAANVFVK